MEGHMTFRHKLSLSGLFAGITAALLMIVSPLSHAAGTAAAPAISEEASAALVNMGKTLLSKQFSFEVRSIRVYAGPDAQALHIYHDSKITVRRPDRLQVTANGDDGTVKMFYDGKSLSILHVDSNKYTTIPVPDTLQKMMEAAMGKLHVDFPLADFFTDAPNKAFLTGVTSGKQVGTVTIDGTPCRHLYFSQTGGIELELWLEQNEKSLPRRLIVTYTSLPGSPSYIAAFSNWDFSIQPTDSDFTFTPPAGATQLDLKAFAAASGKQQ
jgi:hypothetical protein